MVGEAVVELPHEINNLSEGAGKSSSLKEKENFGPSPHRMHAPPDPHKRKGRPCQDAPKSQKSNQKEREIQSDTSPLVFQAAKLRRIYCFCHATACTIASLAFAGGPR
jgi:hypothetical protein